MKSRFILVTFLLYLTSSFCSAELIIAQSNPQIDMGYFFVGGREIIKTKKIKPDVQISAFTKNGVIISETKGSPWYNATLFMHGSVLKDSSGKELKKVTICEACDQDGDLNWAVLHFPEGNAGPGTIEIVQGTGKWTGILGSGEITGIRAKRSDEFSMPTYKISWEIDPENAPNSQVIKDKDLYEYRDECLSFHGPHDGLFSVCYLMESRLNSAHSQVS